jgi:hypothetical protein
MQRASDTFGTPPEGPTFWAFLGVSLGFVFLVYVTQPLWQASGVCP